MHYSVKQYLALGVVTFIIVGALTPVMRAIAIRIGAFDTPNIPRKIHKEPVPYLGGVAIVIGILIVSYSAMLYSKFFSFDLCVGQFSSDPRSCHRGDGFGR